MDAQERIIRRLFSEQHCPHCGYAYLPDSMMVLARRSELWMVMVSCTACQQKDTFVVKFPLQMQGRQRVTSYRLSKPPETPHLQEFGEPKPMMPSTPVSLDDVLDMHLFLKNFNGDFQRLFAEVE